MKQIIVNNISTWYYITEDGKCYNSKTDNYLKGQVNYKNGYLSYNITLPDGSKKRLYAHRLVAENYLEQPLNKNKNQVNHIDGNKLNNISCTYEEVLENIEKRDYNDLHKKVGALKRSDDQVYIDTTNKTIEEVVDIILNVVRGEK